MSKKRSGSKPAIASACYIVQIDDWDWSYSFGVNEDRYDKRPYSDYRHMVVLGKVLLPTKLKRKAEAVELTFMPDTGPSYSDQKEERRPLSVGYVDVRDGRVTGGFTMAIDALDLVMRMLLAARFKYLILDGEAMRYRKARIRHYRFETKVNLEEYPDD
ncbi:hypothetical protein [Bradyrhizobium sp. CCBAU 51753]|uniref:hypothetical protein n=1 Tax=Bradyrhizobium sp. CCBAU 51753 TaxID=1325100 RepID=UPI00188B0CA7|nr:hypothetical protein [Bradyrhizobium sp. CCBAU 51753]QOZ24128.1 hypothetical protein XH93_11500 [Bradyrhizobium sp. CCBAU 51753]